MVDVQTKTQMMTPGQRIKARAARKIGSMRRPGIRVVPRDDAMRRLMKHPSGISFRSEGGVEWPDDIFTMKRLRDGSVKREEEREEKEEKEEKQEKQEKRQSSSRYQSRQEQE